MLWVDPFFDPFFAHLGNQTPSVDEKGFIEQLCKAELTLGLEICYDKLNLPGTKAENRA